MVDLKPSFAAIARSEFVKEQTHAALGTLVPNLTYLFWTRMLDGCMAALHLIERGFFTDALALQRLSIENFAYAVSMLRGKLTSAELEEEAYAEFTTQAKTLRQRDEPHGALTSDSKDALDGLLSAAAQRGAKHQGLNVHNELGKELEHLHLKYRILSQRAGHATIMSAVSRQTPEELAEMLATMKDLLSLINAYANDEVKTRAASGA
jgi:hypothetical protein